ncbi:hypothetical protein [Dactylosporangium sp. NPDC005555]|uniref:hypothetical protein n=1 Tax=Dactylosporangium sp. NPDC005555 TaxID=3154889 RepID=UPI0033BBA0E1
MGEIAWRMPQPGQRPEAVFRDGLTVADVAELLSQPEQVQHRTRVTELIMQVVAPTAMNVLVQVVLYRHDDSLVWWIRGAQAARPEETEQWKQGRG